METVDVLVEGGKATAGPPIGPALGPLGLNIMQVVEAINERTSRFEGMKVPVRIIVDPTGGTFELEIGTPPTSALILKEAGVEKGSGTPGREMVGDLTLEQVVKVARMKEENTLGSDLQQKIQEVLGTCVSLGVTVGGRKPREVQSEVQRGLADEILSKADTESL
ncbi:MAG: 50S ribosomal protein L11 [Candidatus Thermoplasmatota archaeon]|nr:50S ribosomal protein L11 [Candidatus Thermoplasmatota archaeon]